MPPSLQSLIVRLYLRRFRVPRDLLRVAARRYADRTALVTDHGSLTFPELADRVWRLADSLAARGIRRGDRVGYIASGQQDQLEILLASYEIGAVLVGFTHVHPLDVIESAVAEQPPAVFFVDAEVRPDVDALLAERFPATTRIRTAADHEALIAAGRPVPQRGTVAPTDISGLGFTSGTTGRPKAMTVTQGVWLTSLRLSVLNVRVQLGGHDVAMPGMPISGAGSGLILPSLAGGATLVLPTSYDTPTLIDTIERHRVTRAFVTPSTLIDLVDADLEGRDLSSLANIIYGTAPTPSLKIAEAVRRFGAILQQGYGMAEVLPPVSLLQMEHHGVGHEPASREALRSVGRPVPQVRVRIVTEDARPVAQGEPGQVEVASPTVFGGYWNAPELTARAFRDGYLRTRDYGYLDAEGRLVILDRDVDVIDRDGRQLFPREVEETVHEYAAVKEACLVTTPDGQLVLAVSLRRAWRDETLRQAQGSGEQAQGSDGSVGAEIAAFLAERLPEWQRPDRVLVLPELPRSYLNKVLRREIRDALTEGDPA